MGTASEQSEMLESILLKDSLLLTLALLILRGVAAWVVALVSANRTGSLDHIGLSLVVTQVVLVDGDLLFWEIR